jgi:autotransporter-associated beta strand protein
LLARLTSPAVLVGAAWLGATFACAQDATWLANPSSGIYNASANWFPATIPTGTAFFGVSNITGLTFSDDATVGGWTFNAGASAYSFSNNHILVFNGAGIVINGGSAAITNTDVIEFTGASTAGAAAITNNSGGVVDFSGSTGPGGDGKLSAGSIAGAGVYYLGANQLTVGGNNQSTTVSGVISDCGAGGTACLNSGVAGGALVKVGTGTLTLSGANTYTGATTVNAGVLEVDG